MTERKEESKKQEKPKFSIPTYAVTPGVAVTGFTTIDNDGKISEFGINYTNACIWISIMQYLKYIRRSTVHKDKDITVTKLRELAGFNESINSDFSLENMNHAEALIRLLKRKEYEDLRVEFYVVKDYDELQKYGILQNVLIYFGADQTKNIVPIIGFGSHFELIVKTENNKTPDYLTAINNLPGRETHGLVTHRYVPKLKYEGDLVSEEDIRRHMKASAGDQKINAEIQKVVMSTEIAQARTYDNIMIAKLQLDIKSYDAMLQDKEISEADKNHVKKLKAEAEQQINKYKQELQKQAILQQSLDKIIALNSRIADIEDRSNKLRGYIATYKSLIEGEQKLLTELEATIKLFQSENIDVTNSLITASTHRENIGRLTNEQTSYITQLTQNNDTLQKLIAERDSLTRQVEQSGGNSYGFIVKGGNRYYAKYMKYKQKYIALKKLNFPLV